MPGIHPHTASSELPRTTCWLLWGIVAAALVVRFIHLDFGTIHTDEWIKYKVLVLRFKHDPYTYFLHPGLMLNLAWIVNRVLMLFSPYSLEINPAGFNQMIVPARAVNVVAGALTCLPVFWLGRRFFGARAGLLAAVLLAFAPTHVAHARYLKEDILLTLHATLTVMALIAWSDARRAGRPARHWLLLVCVAAGMSLGSKFIGAAMVLLAMVWVMIQGRSDREKLKLVGLVLVGALLTFVAVSPQVLDVTQAQRGFNMEFMRAVRADDRPRLYFWQKYDRGLYFLRYGLGPGMTWPVLLVALIQLALVLRRRPWTLAHALACVALGWYILIELTPNKRGWDMERYVMPCLALLCVFGGGLLANLWNRGNWPRLAAWLVPLGALATTGLQTWAIGNDTRDQALQWLASNGPRQPISMIGLRPSWTTQFFDPHGEITFVSLTNRKELDNAIAKNDVLILTEFAVQRIDRLPKISKNEVRGLKHLRRNYPYVKRFRRHDIFEIGFHNPQIEIRFKTPWPGTEQRNYKEAIGAGQNRTTTTTATQAQ